MARPKTPVSEYKKLMLRLPEELHAECERLARQNHCSLNTQIVLALQEGFAQERRRLQRLSVPTPTALAAV